VLFCCLPKDTNEEYDKQRQDDVRSDRMGVFVVKETRVVFSVCIEHAFVA